MESGSGRGRGSGSGSGSESGSEAGAEAGAKAEDVVYISLTLTTKVRKVRQLVATY